jgi:putative transcription antitermination factor YqgF
MKYLGVDFGLRRVGLSLSEGSLASPYKIVEVKNFKDSVEKISEIISNERFEKIVIGLPEGKIGKTIQGFINALKKRGFDVQSVDETLSSKRALQQMIDAGVPLKKRKFNDMQSAVIILQDYLDTL